MNIANCSLLSLVSDAWDFLFWAVSPRLVEQDVRGESPLDRPFIFMWPIMADSGRYSEAQNGPSKILVLKAWQI
jgi:hypothetical protein